MQKFKHFSLLTLLLILVSTAAHSGAKKDNSGILHKPLSSFPASYGPYRPKGAEICKNDSQSLSSLSNFPVTQKKLKQGVACIVADFDGNGYLDFALLE